MSYFFKKKMICLFLSFILSGFLIQAKAQTLSAEEIKAQMIKDWERAKAYSLEYLNTMPADKYSFKPVDSIRSFAQQMLHLAQGNVNLISNGIGGDRIFANRNLEMSPGAQTKDSVMYLVTASYDFAIRGLQNLDGSKLGEKTGRGQYMETRYAWILKAFEHQTHHRGQTTIYIRLLGIRPPGEKLF